MGEDGPRGARHLVCKSDSRHVGWSLLEQRLRPCALVLGVKQHRTSPMDQVSVITVFDGGISTFREGGPVASIRR